VISGPEIVGWDAGKAALTRIERRAAPIFKVRSFVRVKASRAQA
jgi:hypothetical protein